MFGLSFAVLFFEKGYQVASSEGPGESVLVKMYLPSLPYSGNLDITENIQGLVRQDGNFYNPTHVQHANDTLYVTLQSNEAARDHFFELANAVQLLNDQQTDVPKSPYGKAVELLGSLLKIYLPNQQHIAFGFGENVPEQQAFSSYFRAVHYVPFENSLASPPPERA